MADIKNGLLVENNRVFFPSTNINIFPCSRRGQYTEELNEELKLTPEYYDPEARLNTERTNRLHTAINGFTDKFIVNGSFTEGDTLVFVLKGYYIEIKDFRPSDIAEALSTENTKPNQIYAHLSLHTGISLNVEDYYTEILYRQWADSTKIKYLDVPYKGTDFFVGVSFTADQSAKDTVTDGVGQVIPYFLPLFSKDTSGNWQLKQTSLLPKIEHGDSEDLVKIPGDLTVTGHAQFNTIGVVTRITAPEVVATTVTNTPELTATNIGATTINTTNINTDKIIQNGKAVPAITLAELDNPTRYRLQIELDASKNADSSNGD